MPGVLQGIKRHVGVTVVAGLFKSGTRLRISQALLCGLLGGTVALLGVLLPRLPASPRSYVSSGNSAWHTSKESKTSDGPENIGAIATLDEPFRVFRDVPEIRTLAVKKFPPARKLPALLREYYLRPPPAV